MCIIICKIMPRMNKIQLIYNRKYTENTVSIRIILVYVPIFNPLRKDETDILIENE